MTFPIKGFTPKSNATTPNLLGDIKLSQPTIKNPVFNFSEVKEMGRKDLSLVNNFNDWNMTISGAKEIATETNRIMAGLGYENYPISTKAVASVTNLVNNDILPAVNTACDNADIARANPTPENAEKRIGFLLERFEEIA